MLESPHFDLPDNEYNKELFKSNIDWEKEEAFLKKQEQLKRVNAFIERIKNLFYNWR